MKKSAIIKFLLRLGIFCVVLLALDQALGFAFRKIYFSQRVGQYAQTTYAIDSAQQDIMIFGSSRAVRHYSSPIISQITGLSCYNSGRDAQMIPYATAVEEVTLNRHKPKLVILDINPWELAVNQSKYEKLSILLPYCREHKELVKYIQEISPFEPYKLLSQTYPYNSSIFILASNTLTPSSVKKDQNGYLPLENILTKAYLDEYTAKMKARWERIRTKKEVAEEKGVAYFRQFLCRTAKDQVKTLVVISPTILNNPFELDNQLLERQMVERICSEYPNVTFLDYSTDARFNFHFEKFSDEFHLNKNGAEEFSTILAEYIKQKGLEK